MRNPALLFAAVLAMAFAGPPAEATTLGPDGGSGGSAFSDACPAGQYLIGVSARQSRFVEELQMTCAPWQGAHFGTPVTLGPSHGTGSPNLNVACMPGAGVRHAALSFARDDKGMPSYVSAIALTCHPFAAAGDDTMICIATAAGCSRALAAVDAEQQCPDGEVAAGIAGRADQYVAALGLVCGPAPTGASNVPVATVALAAPAPSAAAAPRPVPPTVSPPAVPPTVTPPAVPPTVTPGPATAAIAPPVPPVGTDVTGAVTATPDTGADTATASEGTAASGTATGAAAGPPAIPPVVQPGANAVAALPPAQQPPTPLPPPPAATGAGGPPAIPPVVQPGPGPSVTLTVPQSPAPSPTTPPPPGTPGGPPLTSNPGALASLPPGQAPQVTSADTLTCLGGGGMTAVTGSDGTRILFMPAAAGSGAAPPQRGQCAWGDRGFRAGEPFALLFPPGVSPAAAMQAVTTGLPFQVHARDNGKGALVVTSVEGAGPAAPFGATPPGALTSVPPPNTGAGATPPGALTSLPPPPPRPPAPSGAGNGAVPATVTQTVNVRAGPGTSSPAIGVLQGGAAVMVATCGGGWCELAQPVAQQTGFVLQQYLRLLGPLPGPSTAQGPGPVPPLPIPGQ